ncbi:hypothetical protein Barb6_02846 [Bacteroidales bacterium Barb6]|nr:hypothetical protein Barb6_02846 [Bacteroidales bacterium Barb6]
MYHGVRRGIFGGGLSDTEINQLNYTTEARRTRSFIISVFSVPLW